MLWLKLTSATESWGPWSNSHEGSERKQLTANDLVSYNTFCRKEIQFQRAVRGFAFATWVMDEKSTIWVFFWQ